MRSCTPTTSAPSATGRQQQESQKSIACPKASPNQSRHRYADPRCARRATAPERVQAAFSFGPCTARFSFGKTERGPAAPRAVGRGGAGERAQFSPQAETELSGLCDDEGDVAQYLGMDAFFNLQ